MKLTDVNLNLPIDAVASVDPSGNAPSRIVPIGKTNENEMILDIGPDTILLYNQIISQAKTVIWNGPMGLIETDKFIHGSEEIAKFIAKK